MLKSFCFPQLERKDLNSSDSDTMHTKPRLNELALKSHTFVNPNEESSPLQEVIFYKC